MAAMTWLVSVNYRTRTECRTTSVTVSAADAPAALAAASDKVRKRRGVTRIDGATILGRPA